MTREYLITGNSIDTDINAVPQGYTTKHIFETSLTRGEGSEHRISVSDDDIVELELEDGTFWIGPALELPKYFDEDTSNLSSRGDGALPAFYVPNRIVGTGVERGFLGGILVKIFKFLSPEQIIVDAVVRQSAKLLDEHIQPQTGLFLVSKNFIKSKITKPIENVEKPYLIFIHGTATTLEGSFGDILTERDGKLWEYIQATYQDRVIAYEHYTISQDPFENAAELFNELPDNITLHIISQSRGGLIGELLCLYHGGNDSIGFSSAQIKALSEVDSYKESLNKMIKSAKNKRLTVESFVRVAAPAAGTHLCSNRLDRFLNVLINGFQLMVPASAPVLKPAKKLLSDVLACKEKSDVLPGLEVMSPDSVFQAVLNSPTHTINAPLSVVEGNAQFDLSLHSIITIISKVVFWGKNDWIVDTTSMTKGLRRRNVIPYFFDQGAEINHFHYFRNEKTQSAIRIALSTSVGQLPSGFETFDINRSSQERGFIMGSYFAHNVTGNRPVVIILPGILGSNLSVNDEEIYLNFGKLAVGGMKRLSYDAKGVEATSIIGDAYRKLGDHFQGDYDIVTFPYDWRLPVEDEAKRFKATLDEIQLKSKGQPIKILAHSMGGVLARHFIFSFPETWKNISSHDGFRLIFLGSPLGGSYLIPEVLVGAGARIKQMAKLDITSSTKELLNVFVNYEGLLNLLPLNTTPHDFADEAIWNEMKQHYNAVDWPILPKDKLESFARFRQSVKSFDTSVYNHPRVIYIAGKSDQTTESFFFDRSQAKGEQLTFTYTDKGDGSVTWESGIPNEFHKSNRLYYVNTSHGDLASDKSLFNGLNELLINNTTSLFKRQPIKTQGGFFSRLFGRGDELGTTEETFTDILLGKERMKSEDVSEVQNELSICVTCGDLFYSKYPVMLGHLSNDAIMGSEAVMDKYLDHVLTLRYSLGIYPDEIGTSAIISKDGKVRTIVVGLGRSESISSYRIEQSLSMAIKKYLLEMYDKSSDISNDKPKIGLSIVLMGSSYLGISVASTINSIISAANRANASLYANGIVNGLLQEIEFIELYEDKAIQAFLELKKIQSNFDLKFRFDQKDIRKRAGMRKRLVLDENADWWTRISITKTAVDPAPDIVELQFTSSSSTARAEKYKLLINTSILFPMIESLSTKENWTPELAKTIFEQLIPNDFKSELNNQQSIILQLDEYTAQFPWELLFDTKTQSLPLSVRVGFVRQLTTETFRKNVYYPSNNKVLIVGDPFLGKYLFQLPGALAEATNVDLTFKEASFDTKGGVKRLALDIVQGLNSDEHRVIHIASHGIFDKSNPLMGGIVIGDHQYLKTFDIHNLSYVPEFVFVNCCFLGNVDSEVEGRFSSRYKMAANIGTQLIEIGVKAVIVAGWAVNDAAAALFSKVFYDHMLKGETFGLALKAARKACFEKYQYTNTWGAYQAYGNHAYKLNPTSYGSSSNKEMTFVVDKQIEIELYNLNAKSDPINPSNNKSSERDNCIERLLEIEKHLNSINSDNAVLYELLAFAFMNNQADSDAIHVFETMKKMTDATFSVKALECYCQLRVKQLQFGSNDIDVQVEGIRSIISSINDLLSISKTVERYDLLAKGYKALFYALYIKKKPFLKEIINIHKAYSDAFELADGNYHKAFMPLLNKLIFEKALRIKQADSTKPIKKGLDQDDRNALELISSGYEQIKFKNQSEIDFMGLMLILQKSICELIIDPKQKQFEVLKEALDKIHKYSLSQYEIEMEKENLNFLKMLFEDSNAIMKFLNQYEVMLESF